MVLTQTETSEGLEPSMTTRYYSRLRATLLLTPSSPAPPTPTSSMSSPAGKKQPSSQTT